MEEPQNSQKVQSVAESTPNQRQRNKCISLKDLSIPLQKNKIFLKINQQNAQPPLIGDGNNLNFESGEVSSRNEDEGVQEFDKYKENELNQNDEGQQSDVLPRSEIVSISNQQGEQGQDEIQDGQQGLEDQEEFQMQHLEQQNQNHLRTEEEFKAYIQGMKNTTNLAILRGISFFVVYGFMIAFYLREGHFLRRVLLILPLSFIALADIITMAIYHWKIKQMERERNLILNPRCCPSHFIIFFILGALNFVALLLYYGLSFQFKDDQSQYLTLTVLFVGFAHLFCLLFLKIFLSYCHLVLVLIWFIYLIFISIFVSFMILIRCRAYKPASCQNFYQRQRVTQNIANNNDLKQNCSVCLQILNNGTNIIDLQCLENNHHYFHQQCAKKWLKKYKTCPNCRKDYKNEIDQKKSIWMKGLLTRNINYET